MSAPLVTPELIAVGTATGVVILEPRGSRRCRLDLPGRTSTPRLLAPATLIAAAGTTLQAFDARCQPLWQRTLGERVASSPSAVAGTIVVATVSGRLEAFGDDGSPKWTFADVGSTTTLVGPSAIATPTKYGPGEAVIEGGVVYVMDGSGALLAFAVEDGQPLWSVGLASSAQSTPVVTEDRVIVGADDGGVHALDSRTHALAWRLATDDRVRGAALIEQDVAYIGSDDRHVYAIDTVSGALRWLASLGGPVRARPASYRNLILVAGGYGDGRVYALSRDDGSRFWEHRTGQGIVSDIAVYGDVLYAVSVDGGIFAFKLWRTFER